MFRHRVVTAGESALRALTQQQAAVLADLFVGHVWRHNEPDDALAFARRARPLISQSVASLVADALGAELLRIASQQPDSALTDLVTQLRVGIVNGSKGQEPR